MTSILQSLFPCLPHSPTPIPSEKQPLLSASSPAPSAQHASLLAVDVVTAILTAHDHVSLHASLQAHEITAQSWTQHLAEWILEKLAVALQGNYEKLGPLVRDAYEAAVEAAHKVGGFVREHPVYATVIALGVLVAVAPWVLEALGFAALGPVEGSFAAAWQARYLGYVPKGSLFSFFQRLGMIWH